MFDALWEHMLGSQMSLLHRKRKEIINAEWDMMADKTFFIKYWRNIQNANTYRAKIYLNEYV